MIVGLRFCPCNYVETEHQRNFYQCLTLYMFELLLTLQMNKYFLCYQSLLSHGHIIKILNL